jgi:hypothetical protein
MRRGGAWCSEQVHILGGSERLRQADKAVDEWMRMHMRCSQSNRYVPRPDMSDVRVKSLP